MARCEECIHEKVCSALIKDGLPWNDGEYPAEAFCMEFRNKADVVPKSELIDEFTKRLHEKLYTIPTVYNSHFSRMVDDIAKDMKGE